MELEESIRRLSLRDGRFPPEAFRFLFESLEVATELAGKKGLEGLERHVTGKEVLAGMRDLAQKRFGPLAAQVWRTWGIHEPIDWGRVVFLLVEEGMLRHQETDSVEDFREDFDFDEVFVNNYRPPLDDLREDAADG